jgi:hypothetical protein
MDERAIVYFISDGGIGKVVCLNFDGDAPVARMQDHAGAMRLNATSRRRGRSPRHDLDDEHVRQISPARDPWEQAKFDPEEVNAAVFESTLDLDGIMDAEYISGDDLEDWFEILDKSRNVKMID